MRKNIKIETDKLFTDLTKDIEKMANSWGKSGLVNIFSKHTTGCIWLTENEILHHADVRFFLDTIAPKWKDPEGNHKNIKYLHDLISLRSDVDAKERINGHSHIRSMFFQNSETVPVEKGKLLLGEWKKIFFIELDPVRKREVLISFLKM
jgi:secondary thiamine-phosphate synthase enzyme|tara:strand:+ start:596 stop:1045 length:450 start_codon:yes stop_codon:yes gene_type:complete